MSLSEYLRNLTDKVLPGLAKQKRRKWEREEYTRWLSEEKCKLETGREIEPPWIILKSDLSPWYFRHDSWLTDIWLPFWNGMSEDEKLDYKKRWNMPTDWDEIVTTFWTNKQ